MIALLAAVPQETELLRTRLRKPVEEVRDGLVMLRGELCGNDITLAHSGVGKAAAAAATVALLKDCQPEALLLFGCGGAYPDSGLVVGDLVVADGEIFADEGVNTPTGFQDLAGMGLPMRASPQTFFNRWPTSSTLREWASRQIAGLHQGPFVTVSSCTGTSAQAHEIANRTGGICENMEGAAVALACQQLATPLLEIRGISNLVEDRDMTRWDLPGAMQAAQAAIIALVQAWPEP